MRILLVEDDPMIGEAVAIALKDAAYAVDWVRDGAAASRAIEHGEHQAVLLDLGLPKRDGLEVLRRLRRAGNAITVIVITARDGVDERILGLDIGADDYLVPEREIEFFDTSAIRAASSVAAFLVFAAHYGEWEPHK